MALEACGALNAKEANEERRAVVLSMQHKHKNERSGLWCPECNKTEAPWVTSKPVKTVNVLLQHDAGSNKSSPKMQVPDKSPGCKKTPPAG